MNRLDSWLPDFPETLAHYTSPDTRSMLTWLACLAIAFHQLSGMPLVLLPRVSVSLGGAAGSHPTTPGTSS